MANHTPENLGNEPQPDPHSTAEAESKMGGEHSTSGFMERRRAAAEKKKTEKRVWANEDFRNQALKIAETRYPIPEGSPEWLVKKYQKAQKQEAQRYLNEASDWGELESADEIESSLTQEAERVLERRQALEKVYYDQEKVISNSEESGDSEKWKQYIADQNKYREWRKNVRLPYLPNWAKWGDAELAVFDYFDGSRIKNLVKSGDDKLNVRTLDFELQKELSKTRRETGASMITAGVYLIIPRLDKATGLPVISPFYRVLITTPESSTEFDVTTTEPQQKRNERLERAVSDSLNRYNAYLAARGDVTLSTAELSRRKEAVIGDLDQKLKKALGGFLADVKQSGEDRAEPNDEGYEEAA